MNTPTVRPKARIPRLEHHPKCSHDADTSRPGWKAQSDLSAGPGYQRKAQVEQMSEQTNVAAPATAADIMRPPLTTVEQEGHVAAAAYLMKHTGATALMVLEAWTDLPIGIITETDIAHAAADGKDANSTRICELMSIRPTVIKTTTSVCDTAKVMTSGHFRHLPVVGDAGLVGIVDIADVCRALLEPTSPGCPPAWPPT